MTDNMINAGVGAYLLNQYQKPEALVDAVYEAICEAKQIEAMNEYWKTHE